jgi:hypothetical protein
MTGFWNLGMNIQILDHKGNIGQKKRRMVAYYGSIRFSRKGDLVKKKEIGWFQESVVQNSLSFPVI